MTWAATEGCCSASLACFLFLVGLSLQVLRKLSRLPHCTHRTLPLCCCTPPPVFPTLPGLFAAAASTSPSHVTRHHSCCATFLKLAPSPNQTPLHRASSLLHTSTSPSHMPGTTVAVPAVEPLPPSDPIAPCLFAAAHPHLPFPHSPTSQVLCELSAVHTSPSMGVGFCTATPAPGSTGQQTCTVEGQPAHAPDITPAVSGDTSITNACQSSSAKVTKGSTGSTQLRQSRACLVLRKGPGDQQGGCEAVNVWGRLASWQLQR